MDDVFLFFEDSKDSQNSAFVFRDPIAEVKATSLSHVTSSLHEIERWRSKGYYIAGYVSYEASYALIDKVIPNTLTSDLPLLHFFIFKEKTQIQFEEMKEFIFESQSPQAVFGFHENVKFTDYEKNILKLKEYFTLGDTYQANYSLRQNFKTQMSAFELYKALRENQKVSYGAFFNLPGLKVLSFSPELFLKKDGDKIITKPMKGTTPRSADKQQDLKNIEFLKKDEKSLAENLMIVDLLRNDLGKIAWPGSVTVENPFEVESYETLHQMITTISAQVDRDISIERVFKALFPCGSITGAPKIRTMEIISELEPSPRGIYTGSLGYITPQNDFCFNVAIRTLTETAPHSFEIGLGGGVLMDSEAQSEFNECLLKGHFVKKFNEGFEIFESFLFDGQGIPSLDGHLARLESSCSYFGFPFEADKIAAELEKASFDNSKKKIKLSLDFKGHMTLQFEELGEPIKTSSIALSSIKTNSNDVFLFHKTTNRKIYDEEFKKARKLGHYEVVFVNEKNELTEASRHNIFVQKNGYWFTPPLKCGVLPGVQRWQCLTEFRAEEKVLTIEDLKTADQIVLTNSVRGVVPVNFSGTLQ